MPIAPYSGRLAVAVYFDSAAASGGSMEHVHFLRQRRQELGLSQNDLELRLRHRGVSLSRKIISAWERGQCQPDLDHAALKALADALRWDPAHLLKALNGVR